MTVNDRSRRAGRRRSVRRGAVPGPDHSCPAGAPTVSLDGTWDHKRLRSTFSECTGGQEQQAADWAALLPSESTEATVHVDQAIGLVRLGERKVPSATFSAARARPPHRARPAPGHSAPASRSATAPAERNPQAGSMALLRRLR